MGTNRYIDDHTTLFVQDGDTAYASDVNNVAIITNTACDRIQAEMDTYLVDTLAYATSAANSSTSAYNSSVSAYNSSVGAADSKDVAISASVSAADSRDNASAYSVSAYNSSVSAADSSTSAYNSYTSGVTLYSGISGAVTGVNGVSGISGSVANNVLTLVPCLPISGGTVDGVVTMSNAMVLGTQEIRYGEAGTPYLTFSSDYWRLGINSDERVTFSNNAGIIARFSDLTDTPSKGFFVVEGDTTHGRLGVSNLGEVEIYGKTAAILRGGSKKVFVDSAAFFPWITTLNLGKNSTDFAWNDIYYMGTSNDISDERLKDISSMGDVSWLYDVNPISFVRKGGDDKRIRFGFGAQSLYKILPKHLKDNSGIVAKDFDEKKNDYNWAISKTELIAPMLKLIQEQKAMIDSLTARVEALEGGA